MRGRQACGAAHRAGIDQQLRQQLTQWGVVPIGPMPAQNPALVALGQALMFDKILSGNRDISCATCHDPLHHGTDGLSLAIGTGGTGVGPGRQLGSERQFVPRNAPSMLNQGLRPFYLFWDGRVSGFGAGPFTSPPDVVLPSGLSNILAAQAMLPVLNRREMRGDSGDVDGFGSLNELAQLPDSQYAEVWRAIMKRLLGIPEYAVRFGAAYPGTPAGALGFQHAANAIAAFLMQGLSRYDSPFDRYLHRDDAALTPEAKRGATLFFGRLPCAQCHNGPLLGGQRFANVGVPQVGPGVGKGAPLDLGRAEVVAQQFPVPSPSSYRFAFRPPPLRNVELTAPYMHDGVYPTLEAVVRHYNDVPTALRTYDVTQLDPALRGMYHGDQATITDVLSTLEWRFRTPLNLTDGERSDLVAFLKSLTDPAARDLASLIPASVPSGLPVRE
ncbi:MAG: c-type cytochrome [Gemmatimonadetes bacterium]|nr:c-type cytochrome [Gemmatimonadota bacterium]